MKVQLRRWILLASIGLLVGACASQGRPVAASRSARPMEALTSALPTSQVNSIVLQVAADAGLRDMNGASVTTPLDGRFEFQSATATLNITTVQQPDGVTNIMVTSREPSPIRETYVKRLRDALAAAPRAKN
jgi:hypothetical protein